MAPQKSEEATALAGIEAMEAFYRAIRMPTTLAELGVQPTDAQIEEMAEKCSVTARGTLGKFRPLGKADMAAIYRAAR